MRVVAATVLLFVAVLCGVASQHTGSFWFDLAGGAFALGSIALSSSVLSKYNGKKR